MMQEEKMSASQALAIKNKKKRRFGGKLPLFVFLGLVAVFIIIAAVVIGIQITENNKIEKAKSVVAQLDINLTAKESEFSENGDWDNDGVANGKEDREGLNVQNEDTDGDGVSDGDELTLATDPLKEDTDGDGLLDGYELMAGLDPKKTSTDGTTPDADRDITVTRSDGQASLTITGDANVADVSIEELDLFGISSNTSVVSNAYDIYTDYSFDSAVISFTLDSAKLEKSGYSYSDLSVLKFDSDSQEYTKLESTSDESAGTISANITAMGTYVVGADATANTEASTRIAFLVDNSGSMYPKELCEPSTENDVDFKRVDFAESLIDKIEGDYTFLISKFTGDYTKLQDFTSDREALDSALSSIRTDTEIFTGTHSQSALESCMNEFTESTDTKYRNIIVMLTDGESDEDNPKSIDELAAIAEEKNIIVLTVGLGGDVDRSWLLELANKTGGKYYSASDANALEDVYKQIVTTLNYDIVDYGSDDDNVSGYSLYNTGFKPSVNGFSFKNFRTTTTSSVDFGMAVLARDWYLGTVTLTLDELTPADESEQKYTAPGYDFSGTDLQDKYESHTELNDIHTTALTSDYADVKTYLDYKSKGDVLKIDTAIELEAEACGWQKTKYALSSGNLEWSYVELLSLDIAGSFDKISSGYSDWEAQLYAALYRLNALQWDDSEYEFNLNGGDDGFERLKELLSQGVPVVTTIDDTHTVNAIGLIQDSECHRKYVLQVYDNNYPGKTKEIYITKTPLGSFSVDGDSASLTSMSYSYTATYEGKQVGLSFSDVPTH